MIRLLGDALSEPISAGLALVLWALLGLMGCGPNARDVAQRTLSAQATVIQETAPARRAFYDNQDAACRVSSESYDEWRSCMRPAYGVARAADAYAHALEAAQDAFDASGAEGFQDALPCLVSAARELANALHDATIPIPDGVRAVLALGEGLAEVCE